MRQHRFAPAGLVLGLSLALAGCAGVPSNRSMDSIHQPVVQKSDYSFDVTTGGAGLAYGEQARLAGWFDAMGLKYGDRVYVDDPAASPATRSVIEATASRYGILLSNEAPQSAGYPAAGTARVILSRSRASVPGCPDWSSKSDANPTNGLSSNYGCAVNSNLSAMVADPQDLIHGVQDTGSTVVMTSNKAIGTYRNAAPSGGGGNTVSANGTKEN